MRVRTQGGPWTGGDTRAFSGVGVDLVGVSQVFPVAAGPGLAGDGQEWLTWERGVRVPVAHQVEVDRARQAGEKSDGGTGVCANRGVVPSFPARGEEVDLEPAYLLSSVRSDALGGTGKPEATESPSPRAGAMSRLELAPGPWTAVLAVPRRS